MVDQFRRVIIAHFWNEEFLLPWWLEHHKKYFDFGIMIDYASTDRSRDIVKEICPDWAIVDSADADFDAAGCDRQVMQYEKHIRGWRIALNVTEFLVGRVDELMNNRPEQQQYFIPSYKFYDWNPDGHLDRSRPLWEQIHTAISYRTDFYARRARSLHNHSNVVYDIGRHWWECNCENPVIFHYANAISSPEMLARRLQIQKRIPIQDRMRNFGFHHTNHGHPEGLTQESLKIQLEGDWSKVTDCREDIIKFTEFI